MKCFLGVFAFFLPFEADAKKYRALSVKPALPEEARKYNVQALAAFKINNFPKPPAFTQTH